MKNENAEKQAMPSTVESKDGVYIYLGLTKREYFWCRVKLNTYAAFLFGLIFYFELGY